MPRTIARPTVTLSLAGQQFVNEQSQTRTELDIIEETAAAEIARVQIDMSAQQADIDLQNAIAENMIDVWAGQTAIPVEATRNAIAEKKATLTVANAHAQAEGEIILSDARLKIKSDQANVSFGHWLMLFAVIGFGSFVGGLWLRLWRVKEIEDQQHSERALVVAQQKSAADIENSRALIAHFEMEKARAMAWEQAMTIRSDGTAFLLVPNREGLPEKHWINREPTIIDAEPQARINTSASRRESEINRPIHIDEIDLSNSSDLQLQLIKFITAIIQRWDEFVRDGREETEGVAQIKLLRHSHLAQYNPDTWMLLTNMLQHNGLIVKDPGKSTRVHPESKLKNLGDLLQFLTNGRVLQVPQKPTSPPPESVIENAQQQETTVKTAKTVAEQSNGAGGQGHKFHKPLMLSDGEQET